MDLLKDMVGLIGVVSVVSLAYLMHLQKEIKQLKGHIEIDQRQLTEIQTTLHSVRNELKDLNDFQRGRGAYTYDPDQH
ncbi:hypothetical protein [Pseudomonas sp. NA-150]|uniref:hypothetical protein n=1 Tax=Pseudomonas sp. NA-150 TaxID=3367525 RepID=UPI0037CA31C8